ncbi:MAG: transposase [Syntrophobacteraceae bacterium]|jgi:transposase-like protein
MTRIEFKRNLSYVKALFSKGKGVLKKILREVIQEILEQGMTDSLGAAKGGCSLSRLGYRSGYYERNPSITKRVRGA